MTTYVKESQRMVDEEGAIFPDRNRPQVIDYSLEQTYGKNLLKNLITAFNKEEPIVELALYYPLRYYIGPDDSIEPLVEGRQKQIVSLIRILLLKRFESSREAFGASCEKLFMKLLSFVKEHDTDAYNRCLKQFKDIISHITDNNMTRGENELDEGPDEDDVPEELIEELMGEVEKLSVDLYDVSRIVNITTMDLASLGPVKK